MTPIELAFRIGVALFVIVAPTLMFLGFWQVLMRMRNGELVEHVMQHDRVAEEWSAGSFVQLNVVGLQPTKNSTERCPNCGATNHEAASYCGSCLTRL